MHEAASVVGPCWEVALPLATEQHPKKWFAVFTRPQNEKSTARQLELRNIESFLPTFESVRQWKNRQRVRLLLPLFPSYLFVRIDRGDRVRVLASPGVLKIIGNARGPVPVADAIVQVLRTCCEQRKIEPYDEFTAGTRVRIKSGAMQGLHGTVVRKNNNLRFVLAIEPINLQATVEIGLEELEPI